VKKIASLVFLSWQVLHADTGNIRVVNGASLLEDNSLPPGAIIVILGHNLANTTGSAPDAAHLPQTLAGVSATIRGNALGLFYAGPTQITGRIDPATPAGPGTLTVTSPNGTFTKDIVVAAAPTPGVFSMFGTGARDGAIVNAKTGALGPYTVTTNGVPTALSIYVTGLDLSSAPTVSIGGVSVPVSFYGAAPCCLGLQLINVHLTPGLAGAGRVEVAVTSGKGHTSNVTEVVILPSPGQGPYPPNGENVARNREISSIAYVPHSSLALVADEYDDVVRVINVQQHALTSVITLPEGAQPVSIAVNDAGNKAVVVERNRKKVAIIDVQSLRVSTEIGVGYGPSYVAMAGSTALVVNQDDDSVSLVDTVTYQVKTVKVGRGPRGVAEDFTAAKVYVTNEDDGTITVIDLNNLANPTTTISLPPNARPSGIQLLPALGLAIITDSVASSNGEVIVLNLANGTTGTILVNPGRNGGATGIASYANTVYFANQGGGSVTAMQFTAGGGSTSTTIKTDLGARALAVDIVDSLVLVANEGSGTVTFIDLVSNQVKSGVNALRSPNEVGGAAPDNHNDRITAQNAPTISSVSYTNATAIAGGGWSFNITINGTNLQQADALYFVVPSTLPAQSNGYVHTAGDEHWHGPYGTVDTHMTASSIVANQAGIQLTATVTISPTGLRGVPRVVRVEAPNGDTSFVASSINTIHVN